MKKITPKVKNETKNKQDSVRESELSPSQIEAILKPYNDDIKRHMMALSEDFQGQVAMIAEQVVGTTDKVDGLTNKVDGLTTTVTRLTDRVDVLTDKVDVLTDKVDVLTDRVDVLTDKVDVLTDRVDVLTDKVDVLTDKLDEVIHVQETHTEMIGAIMEDASEIKIELKNKADKVEVARLERRVQALV